jgi:hypothetical protein
LGEHSLSLVRRTLSWSKGDVQERSNKDSSMKGLKRILELRLLCTLLLSLWGAVYSFGACDDPRYEVGKIYENTALNVLLNVSIRPAEFAPDRLICLAAALKRKYQAPELSVGIFSSHQAALNYKVLAVEYPRNAVLWASKQHAQYYYDAEKHEEYLLIIPDGLSLGVDAPFNTRISLPAATVPATS